MILLRNLRFVILSVVEGFILLSLVCSCRIDPPLHLRKAVEVEVEVDANVDLDVMWQTDWESRWDYAWNVETLGPLGYVQPASMRLHTYTLGPDGGYVAYQVHNFMGKESRVRIFPNVYDFLYHNNDSEAILFRSETEFDDVYAYTRMISKGLQPSSLMKTIRQKEKNNTSAAHAATKAGGTQARAFEYEPVNLMPDYLYSLFTQGQEVSDNIEDCVYIDGHYVFLIKGELHPSTFIYLIQIRLLNNNGRVVGSAGGTALTGMSEGVDLQTGITSTNVVSVPTDVHIDRTADPDLMGARLISFGIPGCNPYDDASVAASASEHYLVLSVAYQDGGFRNIHMDVTDQLRALPTGGVITLELDVNDFPPEEADPGEGGGFNALINGWGEEQGEHTIDY